MFKTLPEKSLNGIYLKVWALYQNQAYLQANWKQDPQTKLHMLHPHKLHIDTKELQPYWNNSHYQKGFLLKIKIGKKFSPESAFSICDFFGSCFMLLFLFSGPKYNNQEDQLS